MRVIGQVFTQVTKALHFPWGQIFFLLSNLRIEQLFLISDVTTPHIIIISQLF